MQKQILGYYDNPQMKYGLYKAVSFDDLPEISDYDADWLYSHNWVFGLIINLEGKMLTIAETAIDDKDKLKATKSLIKDAFSSKYTDLHNLSFEVETIDKMAEASRN